MQWNILFTKDRASHGRRSPDSKNARCVVSGDYESLGHILKTCAQTRKADSEPLKAVHFSLFQYQNGMSPGSYDSRALIVSYVR